MFSSSIRKDLIKGDGVMFQLQELKVGERYEVQPSHFHRRFIGKVEKVTDKSVIFEVENYEDCDENKISEDKLVEISDVFDIKKALGESIFFS